MNYSEVINYLFDSVPMFQQVGSSAYKEGLQTTEILDSHFNHPHNNFHSIHVAGTNGKGSCSHTLAAILQKAGYKVGLYTSPHLIDFRERIKINGEKISEDYVTKFVSENKELFDKLQPSFFELTTALAFKYFSDCKIDVAVVEVGLGGRLDCTNIIHPDLCIITNISLDHTQFLGSTLAKIAYEKAGIIKPSTPVVIGEYCDETKPVFEEKAKLEKAPIYWAEDERFVESYSEGQDCGYTYHCKKFGEVKGELGGIYQIKNTNTILCAVDKLIGIGYRINTDAICEGFAHVCSITDFMGRWQILAHNPLTVCDAGHNIGGIRYVAEQLKKQKYNRLYIVIGMVNDKDINGVLSLMPQDAYYIFTKASIKRALDENSLKEIAQSHHLTGETSPTVRDAYNRAQELANPDDMIFVGGSCFIVADLLSAIKKEDK